MTFLGNLQKWGYTGQRPGAAWWVVLVDLEVHLSPSLRPRGTLMAAEGLPVRGCGEVICIDAGEPCTEWGLLLPAGLGSHYARRGGPAPTRDHPRVLSAAAGARGRGDTGYSREALREP